MALFGGIQVTGQPNLINIRKLDMLPMPCIMEMMQRGFAVDLDLLRDTGDKIATELNELKYNICAYIPVEQLDYFMAKSNLDDDDTPINIDSNIQLCELLFETLGIGADRELKRTKSGKQISTGKRDLEKLRREHEIIGKVLHYKELSKLKAAFCDSLPLRAVWDNKTQTHRIHTQILSTRTATGRYASKEPNLQQIPVRTHYGQLIRKAFVASPGKKLVDCDFSQIELRMLGWIAKANSIIEVYLRDGDIHDNTARKVFGLKPDEKPDKIKHRLASKRVNFGIQNGTTKIGLYAQLVSEYGANGVDVPDWLTEDWCDWFIKRWLEEYFEVPQFFSNQHYRAYRYGLVWDEFGRIRLIPEVKSVHGRIVEAGLRQAQNMPITATAAELMKLAIAEVHDFVVREIRTQGIECDPLLTIHDEGIWEIDEKWADAFKDVVGGIFSNVMIDKDTGENLCPVPIRAEGTVLDRWEKE